MFQIGDKVVYPLHGAGVIHAIEEKEVLGKKETYYVIEMVMGKVLIMVPITKSEELGLRAVVDADEMNRILESLHKEETHPTTAWNQRYRINMTKMKSGDLHQGIEVIRDLIQLSRHKTLGVEEKKMLDNAMQILISELSLVRDIGKEQATLLLDENLRGA
jgi:CarD family transcriptional regulator